VEGVEADTAEALARLLASAAAEASPASRPEHRFALLLAEANRFLEERGLGRIIVTGGYAVELLTGGVVRTLDVDVIVEGFEAARVLEAALKRLEEILGLERAARGPILPLAGAEKAFDVVSIGYRPRFQPLRVEVPGHGWFYLEAPEELVLRYLREALYWGTREARLRALLLLATLLERLDLPGLREAARGEDERLAKLLDELVEEARRIIRGQRRS